MLKLKKLMLIAFVLLLSVFILLMFIKRPIQLNVTPESLYQIQTGTLIPAQLINGIDTSAKGTLIAQISANIYDTVTGKYLLIPKGSKLTGRYISNKIAEGQRQLTLVFNKIIRPDGSSILLGDTTKVDSPNKSSIEDKDNKNTLDNATISTVFSVGAGVATKNGISKPSIPSQQTSSSTKSITADIKPILFLPPGHQFKFMVRKDMVLSAYKPINRKVINVKK